jgi:1-hydroxycarotenoid 3,4-desaturase
MLIAHVERTGVWTIDGGMHRLATGLADCAVSLGATIRYDKEVSAVLASGGRASGVRLADGECLDADAVIVNADVAAVAGGLFGADVRAAAAKFPPQARSLSAMTWSLVARAEGFPLSRHSVFFSRDYQAEFDDIFHRSAVPSEPTVYVCAQDRADDDSPGQAEERLLVLINAPAIGDRHQFDKAEVHQCAQRTFAGLQRCGLQIQARSDATSVTTPTDFNKLFPATGGALYGRSTHGWTASFQRPGARTKIKGLYLAGGSTHPGPGVPMAALSGRSAAASLLADLTSTGLSPRTVMRGGTSTH